jgi:tRNA(adenine34) deaminase
MSLEGSQRSPNEPAADPMLVALDLAAIAASLGEVPVGAVVTKGGVILARAHNLRETHHDPTAHAELVAIRQAAAALGTWRLDGCTVWVTLEPCAMCAGAMVSARVARCVFGCADPKGGFLGSLGDLSAHPVLNHRFEVTSGVHADACAEVLRSFFRARRRVK